MAKDKFRGYFPGPHGIYYQESPQAQEQRKAERRAKEQAKHERFRQSCEKGRRFLSRRKVLEHWLKQSEIALAGPKKYWGNTKKFSWPKDKAIIYAVMLVCIENTGSAVKVIPDSLQQTKNYRFNEYVFTWVEEVNVAVEFMDYIEADLEGEGLLPSKPDKTDQSETEEKDETQDEVIILDDFMEKYCELKDEDVKSKRALIYKHSLNKKSDIELPQIVDPPYKPGQRKSFYTKNLISNWSAYRKVMPTLPPLKAQKSKS